MLLIYRRAMHTMQLIAQGCTCTVTNNMDFRAIWGTVALVTGNNSLTIPCAFTYQLLMLLFPWIVRQVYNLLTETLIPTKQRTDYEISQSKVVYQVCGLSPLMEMSYTTSSIFFKSYFRASNFFLRASFFKFSKRKPAFMSDTKVEMSNGRW